MIAFFGNEVIAATQAAYLRACSNHAKTMVPRVRPENQRREETLAAQTAQAILDYASTFHYASLEPPPSNMR